MPSASRNPWERLTQYPVGGIDWTLEPERMQPGQYELLINADPNTGLFRHDNTNPPAGALLAPADLSSSGIPGNGHSSTRWNGRRWYISLDGGGNGNEPKVFFAMSAPEDGTAPPLSVAELNTLIGKLIPCYDATHQALHVYAKDDNRDVVALAQTPDNQALVVFTDSDVLAITGANLQETLALRHAFRGVGTFNRRTVWQDNDGVFWLSNWMSTYGPTIRLWRFPGEPLSIPVEGLIARHLNSGSVPAALDLRKDGEEIFMLIPLQNMGSYDAPAGSYWFVYNLRTGLWHTRNPSVVNRMRIYMAPMGSDEFPISANRYMHWLAAGIRGTSGDESIRFREKIDRATAFTPLDTQTLTGETTFTVLQHFGQHDTHNGRIIQPYIEADELIVVKDIWAEYTIKEIIRARM